MCSVRMMRVQGGSAFRYIWSFRSWLLLAAVSTCESYGPPEADHQSKTVPLHTNVGTCSDALDHHIKMLCTSMEYSSYL